MHSGASVQWAQNSAKCVVWTWKFGVLGQGFRVQGSGFGLSLGLTLRKVNPPETTVPKSVTFTQFSAVAS